MLRLAGTAGPGGRQLTEICNESMFTDNEGLFSFRPRLRWPWLSDPWEGSRRPSHWLKFELVVERVDRGVTQRLTLRPWDGTPTQIRIDLQTGAARIEVAKQDGTALGSRTVVLEERGDGGARFEAITTPRGFATIERMPVGEYVVRVEGCADLVEGGPARLRVKAGEDTVARFVFR